MTAKPHNYDPNMLRTNGTNSRRAIVSTCTKCLKTWTRRYRKEQGEMCKSCTGTESLKLAIEVIKSNKVIKRCVDCKSEKMDRHSLKCRDCWKKKPYGGETHWNWKGGITPINYAIRRSYEYKQWRRAVFERDRYTCQHCKAQNTYIEADHIKPFAFFPKLRLDITNGRTLCQPCHIKTATYKQRKLVEV